MKKNYYIINIIFIVLIVLIACYELLGVIISSNEIPIFSFFYLINLMFSIIIIISFCVYKKYKSKKTNHFFLILCLVKFLPIMMILISNLIK